MAAKGDAYSMDTLNKTWVGLACSTVLAGLVPTAGAADDVAAHMHEHLDAVVAIQQAVIAGQLDATRESAHWLVEHPSPAGLGPDAEAYAGAMRAAAGDVQSAADLAAAADATARLGLACGGCHTANNVEIEFDEVDRPSSKDKRDSHMQRHAWAADRMWEGLIGPSGYMWSQGANLLFESPLRADSLEKEGEVDALTGMARRVHQLAANATAVSDPEGRAEIYAEFIANCAACHSEIGKGPR
jgi:cytochrome c553